MEFKYKQDIKDDKDVVAAIYKFDGGSSLCLCIKTEDPNKYIWIYEKDRVPTIQSVGFSESSEPIKKFYKGDEITLKF